MLRREGEYKPPGKLIGVTSPTLYLGTGVSLFIAGVVLLAVVLIAPMQRTRRHPEDPHLRRAITGAGGMVTAVAGAAMFVVGYRRRKRLAREGRTAQAVVIGRWWSRWGGKANHYHVAYEFVAQLPDGSTPSVACRISNKKLYDQVQIGDEFTVRYLPSNLRVGDPEH